VSQDKKVTFDMLFNKYFKQKSITSDRPLKKDEVTHTSREVILASQSSDKVHG
jgi:hypothetical protein